MDKKERSGGYVWPAITGLLVSVPIYTFGDEESTLHLVLRVAWLALLILSLVEIGRKQGLLATPTEIVGAAVLALANTAVGVLVHQVLLAFVRRVRGHPPTQVGATR